MSPMSARWRADVVTLLLLVGLMVMVVVRPAVDCAAAGQRRSQRLVTPTAAEEGGTAGAASSASLDPATAAILYESRSQSVDGRSAVAYRQQDGVQFSESTGADGERRGSYSYVGGDGRRYSVQYTAGRGGFRIVRGDHVPTLAPPATQVAPQALLSAAAPFDGVKRYRQPVPVGGFVFSQAGTPPPAAAAATAAAAAAAAGGGGVAAAASDRAVATAVAPLAQRQYHIGRTLIDRTSNGYTFQYTHTP